MLRSLGGNGCDRKKTDEKEGMGVVCGWIWDPESVETLLLRFNAKGLAYAWLTSPINNIPFSVDPTSRSNFLWETEIPLASLKIEQN